MHTERRPSTCQNVPCRRLKQADGHGTLECSNHVNSIQCLFENIIKYYDHWVLQKCLHNVLNPGKGLHTRSSLWCSALPCHLLLVNLPLTRQHAHNPHHPSIGIHAFLAILYQYRVDGISAMSVRQWGCAVRVLEGGDHKGKAKGLPVCLVQLEGLVKVFKLLLLCPRRTQKANTRNSCQMPGIP